MNPSLAIICLPAPMWGRGLCGGHTPPSPVIPLLGVLLRTVRGTLNVPARTRRRLPRSRPASFPLHAVVPAAPRVRRSPPHALVPSPTPSPDVWPVGEKGEQMVPVLEPFETFEPPSSSSPPPPQVVEKEIQRTDTSFVLLAAKHVLILSEGSLRPHPKILWYGRTMKRLCDAGKTRDAFTVLEQMREKRYRPNEVVFNTLMAATGREGRIRSSFKLYNTMKKFGLKPNERTFLALFNSCSQGTGDRLTRLKKLEQEMDRWGITPNVPLLNSMMKAYLGIGQPDKAMDLYRKLNNEEGIQGDTISYVYALRACAENVEQALSLFEDMKASTVKPDAHVYGELIDICLKARRNNTVMDLLWDMEANDDVDVNAIIVSKAVRGLARHRNFQKAWRVFEYFKDRIHTDTPLYNDALRLCARGKRADRALELLNEMNGDRRPNIQTVLALMSVYKKVCDPKTAFRLFLELRHQARISKELTEYHFHALVRCAGVDARRCLQALRWMTPLHLMPDSVLIRRFNEIVAASPRDDPYRDTLQSLLDQWNAESIP